MVLIPVGHEHASSRRIPWVTLAILVLCLAAFALTGFGTWNTPFKAAERNEGALRYFMEHPYLTLRPEVEKALFGDDQATNRTVIEGLKASHPTPAKDVVAREQAALDRQMAAAFNDPRLDPFRRFGLVPGQPQPVAWIAHLFLHTGWLHLIGCLFMLYLLAPFLEEVWGRPLFTGLYLLSGIVAAGMFTLTHKTAEASLVGAAGAIAGCMGALLAHYRLSKVHFFYWVGFKQGTFGVPAWVMLVLWLGVQAMLARVAGGSGVGPEGLVAGFAVGALAMLGLGKARPERHTATPAVQAKAARPGDATASPAATRELLAKARAAREEGDLEIAISLLRQHLAENPGERDTVLALWEVSLERGSAAEVAPAMKGVVRAELQNGQLEQAAAHWVELTKVAPTMTLDPGSLLKMVSPLCAAHRNDDALAVLRRAMLTAGTALPFGTAIRIATLAGDLDPRLARSVLQLVLKRGGLDPTERQQAEKLLAALPESALA